MSLPADSLNQGTPAQPPATYQQRTDQRLFEELQALSCRIEILNEIAVQINRQFAIDEILQLVGQKVKWLLDFDHCGVCLCQADDLLQYDTLLGPALARNIWENNDESPIKLAIRTKRTQLLPDYRLQNSQFPFRSLLVIPMESEGKILGAIHFSAQQPQIYTQEDVRVAYLLALQLAGAIRNARRFEEINQVNQQLENAYIHLRQAEKSRDDLVHMLIHDLRNPVTTINFSLSIAEKALRDVVQSNAPLRSIQRAQKASQQILMMVNELLDIHKLDAAALQPILAPVDIASLIMEKSEIYQVQAETLGKTFLTYLPAHLPLVLADAGLISRVIDNLVTNAFKYTPLGGHIEVTVSFQDDMLYLAVHDDGPGIASADQERIFHKFVQVQSASGAPIRNGTGLGLTFCRLVVRAHGGDIWVESNSNQGSTFIFNLPGQGE